MLQAKFDHAEYNVNHPILFANPYPLSHKISDYCLGWTMSQPNLTIFNDETVYEWELYPSP